MGLKGLLKKCFIGSTHDININIVNTDKLNEDAVKYTFISKLQQSLDMKGLSVFQFEGQRAISNLGGLTDVCNKEYLDDILLSPVWKEKNGTVPYVTIISEGTAYKAFCYFEVSNDKTKCTIHLLCSNYKEQTKPPLKLGALLMNYVITLVAHLYKDLREVFLIAETDRNNLEKLINYYKEFNFIPVDPAFSSGDDNIFQQKMVLNVSTLSQCAVQKGGASKQYVKYQNRKYLVRHDNKKKAYIISKGETVYLKNVKHTKLHV